MENNNTNDKNDKKIVSSIALIIIGGGVLMLLGAVYSDNFEAVKEAAGYLTFVIILIVVIGVLMYKK